jgi:hypothetical protein
LVKFLTPPVLAYGVRSASRSMTRRSAVKPTSDRTTLESSAKLATPSRHATPMMPATA